MPLGALRIQELPSNRDRILALFSLRLKELMKERGETQSSLARRLDEVSQPTVSEYVRGETVPGGEALAALARHFAVSSDYLLGLCDVRAPQPLLSLPPGTWLADARVYHRKKVGRTTTGSKPTAWKVPEVVVVIPPGEVDSSGG